MVLSRSELTVKRVKRELQACYCPGPFLLVLDRYALLYSSFYSIFFNRVSGNSTTWSPPTPSPMDSPLHIISLYCSWQRRGHFSLQRDSPHPAPLWKSPAGLTKKGGHITQGLCRAEWDVGLEVMPQGHLSPCPVPRKPDPYHLYP